MKKTILLIGLLSLALSAHAEPHSSDQILPKNARGIIFKVGDIVIIPAEPWDPDTRWHTSQPAKVATVETIWGNGTVRVILDNQDKEPRSLSQIHLDSLELQCKPEYQKIDDARYANCKGHDLEAYAEKNTHVYTDGTIYEKTNEGYLRPLN